MGDFGIKISVDGVDVTRATQEQLLLSMSYPHAKLDTQNDNSFQNIRLTFQNNPPGSKTLVHSFAHEYTYVPSFWVLMQVEVPPISITSYQAYSQDVSVFLNGLNFCVLTTEVTDTDVNFYTEKGGTLDMTGTVVLMRPYVFVEDVGV